MGRAKQEGVSHGAAISQHEIGSPLFYAGKLRESSLIVRMLDEQREPFDSCLFPFCADDPVGAYPLVPRGLRTEESPSGFIGAKLLFLFAGEAGALSLLVGVDGGFLFAAGGEGFEASGMHQFLLCEPSDEVDVDRAPSAVGVAGSETNGVAGFVEALADAVDPAETKGRFDRFWPGDAGLSGIFLVKADEEFAEFVVMGFEPGTEIGWRREKGWFWRHGGLDRLNQNRHAETKFFVVSPKRLRQEERNMSRFAVGHIPVFADIDDVDRVQRLVQELREQVRKESNSRSFSDPGPLSYAQE